jgi:mono/diheme cytochrome c family protein
MYFTVKFRDIADRLPKEDLTSVRESGCHQHHEHGTEEVREGMEARQAALAPCRRLVASVVLSLMPCGCAPPGGRASPPAAAQAGPLASEAEYQGWRYYQLYCARCHGDDALGSMLAPDLRHAVSAEGGVTHDSLTLVVRRGSDDKQMPSFDELLDASRIDQVYAYIKARSEGRLPPGRPRRPPS